MSVAWSDHQLAEARDDVHLIHTTLDVARIMSAYVLGKEAGGTEKSSDLESRGSEEALKLCD